MFHSVRALAIALFGVVSIGSALAAEPSPIGRWQITTGEARYAVTACGGGGAQLCAKLVWLRADQRTDDKVALLNTFVVRGAEQSGDKTWSGSVTFEGHNYQGTVTLVSKNFMTLQGCAGLLCQTYEFTRL